MADNYYLTHVLNPEEYNPPAWQEHEDTNGDERPKRHYCPYSDEYTDSCMFCGEKHDPR